MEHQVVQASRELRLALRDLGAGGLEPVPPARAARVVERIQEALGDLDLAKMTAQQAAGGSVTVIFDRLDRNLVYLRGLFAGLQDVLPALGRVLEATGLPSGKDLAAQLAASVTCAELARHQLEADLRDLLRGMRHEGKAPELTIEVPVSAGGGID